MIYRDNFLKSIDYIQMWKSLDPIIEDIINNGLL